MMVPGDTPASNATTSRAEAGGVTVMESRKNPSAASVAARQRYAIRMTRHPDERQRIITAQFITIFSVQAIASASIWHNGIDRDLARFRFSLNCCSPQRFTSP